MRKALTTIAMLGALSAPAWAAPVMDVSDLVESQGPAVVNISTTTLAKRSPNGMSPDMPGNEDMQEFFRRFFPDMPGMPGGSMPDAPSHGTGSGFIVGSDGTILTNAHVVRGADEVIVKLTDKRKFTAKVIGTDARTDVAVLKITAQNLPAVKLGNPDALRVGEAVAAIGSPFGFENSVTAGIVSAKGRSLPSEAYVPYIQTDVAINPGNSGGPLFNMKGEVVGINSQIYSRSGGYQGVSFAIPIDVAMEVVSQLKSGGKVSRGWLGVVIQEVSSDLAESFRLDRPRGALIAQVQPDGPAAKAGLQAADVILKFNGKPVENSGDLPRMVGTVKPGSSIPLEIWRKGKAQTVSVVVTELPTEEKVAGKSGRPYSRGGLALAELTAEQRREVGIDYGLLVQDATGDALRAGIRSGDVILAVNNGKVATVEAFRKAIAAVPTGKAAAILVKRGDGSLYIPLKISAD